MRRTVPILVAMATLAVVAAGCGRDEPDTADNAVTTTSESSGSTADSATETTTSAVGGPDSSTGTSAGVSSTSTTVADSMPTEAHTDEPACLYRKRLLVSDAELDGLIDDGVVDGGQITEIQEANELDALGVENFTDADFEALVGPTDDRRLHVYDIGDQDPLAVAETVVTNGIGASPILATTITGHWTYAPGTAPTTGPEPQPPAAFRPSDRVVVGVVDTGYTETASTPTWLSERVEAVDASVDEERATGDLEGHGKFVASIIVQQQPQAYVRIAAMAPVPKESLFEFAEATDAGASTPAPGQQFYVSDELQLLSAVGRLLENGDGDYDALNLSVGTWTCPTLSNSALAITAALDRWTAGSGGAPIVAAAGNHGDDRPADAMFVPGQLQRPDVFGVGALDSSGQLASFSNVGAYATVGDGLLGVRLDGEGAYWGGTSFASAVVAAVVAENAQPPAVVDLSPALAGSLER